MDINECVETPNGGCDPLRICSNLPGSFECGPCIPGYVEDGTTGCKFADPCSAGPQYHDCEKDDYCINHIVGEYYCQCPLGLLGNGRQCARDTDLDGVPNTALTIGCNVPQCNKVGGFSMSLTAIVPGSRRPSVFSVV